MVSKISPLLPTRMRVLVHHTVNHYNPAIYISMTCPIVAPSFLTLTNAVHHCNRSSFRIRPYEANTARSCLSLFWTHEWPFAFKECLHKSVKGSHISQVETDVGRLKLRAVWIKSGLPHHGTNSAFDRAVTETFALYYSKL